MAHHHPILIIDRDDEMDVASVRAPVPASVRVQNAENLDPNAEIGPDEVRDMIPHVQSRNAGTPIFNQHKMTVQELLCLSQVLHSLAEVTGQAATMRDLISMLNHTFNGWDSSQGAGRPAPLVDRKFEESRVQVGFLSQDHPLPAGRGQGQVPAARRAGAPIFFGITLQYEDGTVDWAWRDRNNSGVSPRYVTLLPGKTQRSIRKDILVHFDKMEYDRIRVYNSRLAVFHVRCIIKKWANRGSSSQL